MSSLTPGGDRQVTDASTQLQTPAFDKGGLPERLHHRHPTADIEYYRRRSSSYCRSLSKQLQKPDLVAAPATVKTRERAVRVTVYYEALGRNFSIESKKPTLAIGS
ncbi:hypothetical protein J6590_075703 [Homalodisca vitripennis]|nr:hypothetical protein J6590_075703 [Homalodisca vitripennis]